MARFPRGASPTERTHVADEAVDRIHIDRSPDECWTVATDYENYPEWAKNVKEVSVLERDDEGRGSKVELRVAAMGKSLRSVYDYDYSGAPGSFSWSLAEGDMLKSLEGRYSFEADGNGTRVVYELAVEVAVPMPGFMKKKASRLIMGDALKELKRRVESD